MSRSRFKIPIMGIAGRVSCKLWRSKQNRKYRAYTNNLIRHHKYDDILAYKGRFGNEWDSPRDGKQWLGDWKNKKCGIYSWYTYKGIALTNCKDSRSHYRCNVALKKYMRK